MRELAVLNRKRPETFRKLQEASPERLR